MRRILILMAKQPQPGQTKTRLIPALTAEQAANLYHCFLLDRVTQMQSLAGDITPAIAFTPSAARSYFQKIAPDFTLIVQQGETLSERLIHVFQQAFDDGYQQVVAIDGDSVTLPTDHLHRAFAVLDRPDTDLVLGPSPDGGYYAIGMKQANPAVFNVAMSTSRTREDTLAQAAQAGLRVSQLSAWYDVDYPDDLVHLKRELANSNSAAPHTAKFVRSLSLSDNG